MKKEIWKNYADIPQNTLFMMDTPMRYFFEVWPKIGLGNKLYKYFTHLKGDESQMVFPVDSFNAQAELIANKMLKNPDWGLKTIKTVEESCKAFLKETKAVKKLNLKKMTKAQIISLLKKLSKNHSIHHGLGAGVSWMADADKERVTKGIMKKIEKKLEQSAVKKSLPEIFALLTTPTKESQMETEEKNFLKIAAFISSKNKLKRTFIQADLDDLTDNIKNLDAELFKMINRHYYVFAPFTYQYRGPAYPLSDYLGRWQAFLRDGSSATNNIKKIDQRRQKIKAEQIQMIKELKLSLLEKKLIKMAQEMVFIKDFRKNTLYQAMFYYEYIFKEIGRRLHVSVGQIQYLRLREIFNALNSGEVDTDLLNQRKVECIDYWYKKNGRSFCETLVGKKAKDFLKKINWQKTVAKRNKLTGTCAYPGKVSGTVKVINVPQQMSKMKPGDIMVAHNTNPNLVPAMKKAKALVSGAGGLTCHTAIVAREMQVPCVVGAENCDRILKDGDQVEVDATNGIIKKI
jgi:phosphohistidine swiveling domain-containing protein